MKKTYLGNGLNVYRRCLVTAAMIGAVATAGIHATEVSAAEPAVRGEVAGRITLSAVPEIQVGYDARGNVVTLEGLNEDGKKIVSEFGGYTGRDCDDVLGDLVMKFYDGGYFEETVGGKTKNIVVKFEKDSWYPENDFAEDVAEEVRRTAGAYQIGSSIITVDGVDCLENGYIGEKRAEELVLDQLELKDASFKEQEYKLDDGVYEMEFLVDGVKYEFEVDAVTGQILEADRDHNDDWGRDEDRDDRDDRYNDREDDNRYDDGEDRDEKYDDRDDDKKEDNGDDEKYDDREEDEKYDDGNDDKREDDRDVGMREEDKDDDEGDNDKESDDKYDDLEDDDRYDDDLDNDD